MQVKKIEAYFDAFQKFLEDPDSDQQIHIWESQKLWQENWNLEATDLDQMYNRSLQNSYTRRLWNRESYEPKAIMRKFAKLQGDYFRQMFSDLFNENKDVEGRLSRFSFYCDQLLEMLREKHPKKSFPSHFHDDGYEISSIYLTFQFPEKYIPYRLALFQTIMRKFGAPKPVLAHDTERYFKVAQTLSKLISKREDITELHQQRLKSNLHYMQDSLLLVYDFCCFVEENDLPNEEA